VRPIRIALQLHPQHADYAALRRAASEGEELGVDIIYNWEGGAVHPFVGAGLGVYLLQRRDSGDDIGDSEGKLGGVLLGGIEYFTSNTVSIKGEASYHLISNADGGFAGRGPRNPDGFKLTVGLKKYF